MKRRILKKRIDVSVAQGLSVSMVLQHARPSLWRLPFGTQRHLVYRKTVTAFGVHPAHAKRATWLTFRRLRRAS